MLYRAILTSSFGQNARRPLYAAVIRLIIGLVGFLMVGVLLAKQLSGIDIPVPGGLHGTLTIAVIIQLYMLAGLLTMHNILQSSSDTTPRLLLAWPLPLRRLWLSLQLPNFVIMASLLLVFVPPLFVLALLPHMLLGAAITLGSVAALSVMQLAPRRHGLTLGITCALAAAEIWLIFRMNAGHGMTWLFTLMLVLTLLVVYFVGARSCSRFVKSIVAPRRSSSVTGSSLSPAWWYIKKIVRASTTRLGCISGMALCGAIVFALQRHYTDGLYLLPAYLLAAVAVADIRSVAVRLRPPEIVLRGTCYFFVKTVAGAALFGIMVNLPIIVAVGVASGVDGLLSVMHAIALGVSIGLFVSVLVAPGERDVSSQILATLICSGISLALSMTPFVWQPLTVMQSICGWGIAGIFVVVACFIEYFRNSFTWRKV